MRYSRIIAPMVLITMLSACQSRFLRVEADQPNDVYQICTKLKRDIIFYNNNPNHNFQWRSPGDMARYMQDYQRYNCEAVLAHHDNVTFKNTPLSVPPPGTGGKLQGPVDANPPSRHSGNPARASRAQSRKSSVNSGQSYQRSSEIPDRFR